MKRYYELVLTLLCPVVLGMASIAPAYAAPENDVVTSEDFEDNSSFRYLTTTRLSQSPHDTPASVSIITADTIEKLQIRTIPEALKHIAGMISSDASGNQSRVSYHGNNGIAPRRMQVLVDGMAIFRPGYAEVTWDALPISIHDVENIEVTRSPSASTFGANAMLAVVNITTKDAYDISELGIIGTAGSRDTRASQAHVSGDSGDLRYRVSVASNENEGYDTNHEGGDRHDGVKSQTVNGKFNYRFSPDTDADLFVGYSDAKMDVEFRQTEQQTFPDTKVETFLFITDAHHSLNDQHELAVRSTYQLMDQVLDWRTCIPTIFYSEDLRALQLQNPEYASTIAQQGFPTGGTASDDALRNSVLGEFAALGSNALTPICGDVNEDSTEKRADLELEVTSLWADSLRTVAGINASNREIDSDTYFLGEVDSENYQLFGNAEYRIGKLVTNFGMMAETFSGGDDTYLSPRLGVNYRLNQESSIRFVLSKAERAPDIFLKNVNWNYYAENFDNPYPTDGRTSGYFYRNAVSEGHLDSEKIIAREISFFNQAKFNFGNSVVDHTIDVKAFRNTMYDLVSEKLQFFDYNPTNNGGVDLQGAEIDALLSFTGNLTSVLEKVTVHFNYAYIDSDTDDFYEETLYARHSGATYLIFDYESGWMSTLSYYGNSSIVGESFDGFEAGGGRTFASISGELTIKAKAVYWPNKEHSFVVDETFSVKNINDSSMSYYVTLDYSF